MKCNKQVGIQVSKCGVVPFLNCVSSVALLVNITGRELALYHIKGVYNLGKKQSNMRIACRAQGYMALKRSQLDDLCDGIKKLLPYNTNHI